MQPPILEKILMQINAVNIDCSKQFRIVLVVAIRVYYGKNAFKTTTLSQVVIFMIILYTNSFVFGCMLTLVLDVNTFCCFSQEGNNIKAAIMVQDPFR